MTPMLGIMASSITGGLSTNSYQSIATTTVGSGGTANITFSSIPATYTHLQVRFIAKNVGTQAAGDYDTPFAFNSDTTYTNYRSHYLGGNGATTTAGTTQAASNYSNLGDAVNSGTGTSNMFSAGIVDVLNYANTSMYKTGRSLTGSDRNGSGNIYLLSSVWMNTAAINRIDITCTGGNFAQYSSFALYGIK